MLSNSAISDVTLAIKQDYRKVIYATWTFSCTHIYYFTTLSHVQSQRYYYCTDPNLKVSVFDDVECL